MYDPNRPHVNDYKYRDLPFKEKIAQSERDAMLYDIQQTLKPQQNNTTVNNSSYTSTGKYYSSTKYTKKDLRTLRVLDNYSVSLITWLFLALFASVITGIYVWGNPTANKLPFYISVIALVVLGVIDVIINVVKNYMQSNYYIEKHYEDRVKENRELVKRAKQ